MTFTKRLKGRGVRLWASRATRRRDPSFVRLGLVALEDRVVLSFTLSSTAWTPIGPAPITNGQVPGSDPVSGRVTGVVAQAASVKEIICAPAPGVVGRANH